MTFGFVFKTAVTSWFLHAVTKYSINLTSEWTELIIKHTNLNCFGILRIINRLKRSNILCFKTQLAYSLQPLMIMCKLFRWIWKRSDEVCVHAVFRCVFSLWSPDRRVLCLQELLRLNRQSKHRCTWASTLYIAAPPIIRALQQMHMLSSHERVSKHRLSVCDQSFQCKNRNGTHVSISSKQWD